MDITSLKVIKKHKRKKKKKTFDYLNGINSSPISPKMERVNLGKEFISWI